MSFQLVAQDAEHAKQVSLKVISWFQQKQNDSIYAMFDQRMQKAVTLEQLGMIWTSFESNDGPFQKHGQQKTSNFQNYLLVETFLQFEKKAYNFRLTFDAENKISGLFFVPFRTAKPRNEAQQTSTEWREENINVKTGGIVLPGTICLPTNTDDFPIVVMVHGSGPQDRDVRIGPNKIFAQIAHALAKKGIASLRYDKRSFVVGQEGKNYPLDGLENIVIDDALAAIDIALRTVPQDNKVFLLGHSLGAMLSPKIAQRRPQLGGVLMLAASAFPLEDEVLRQSKYLLKQDGFKCNERKEYKALKKKVKNVKKIDEFLALDSVPNLPLINDTSFWRDIHHLQVANDLKQLHMPVILLQGERDYQVTMESMEEFKEQMEGKKNIEYRSYPKLNHLFLEGEGKSYPSEYQKKGNIPATFLSDISLWILSKN